MKFDKIEIHQWQQFEAVEINFHKSLTVITGANGSGKTTLLNLLAKHSGWQMTSLAVPKKMGAAGLWTFIKRFFKGYDKSHDNAIGSLKYDNGVSAKLAIPTGSTQSYHISIEQQQPIRCLFIPSHRSTFRYEQLSNIPTQKKQTETAFSEVSQATRNIYFGGGGQSASYFIKSTLIGWAIQGYGVSNGSKQIMPTDIEQMKNYEGFQEVLRKVLPKTLGFNEFEIRNMEIVFICNNGNDEFLLETASGGISAIIDLAWQIYMFNVNEKDEFTVIIDEVENHLHPSMQRGILPDFINAFPNAAFIISTHSPLVVNSVRDSRTYVLKYNTEKKIISTELDFTKKAKSANEILDEVLGVSFSMPIWAEEELSRIIEKYSKDVISKDNILLLQQDLAALGMEKLLPSNLNKLNFGDKHD
jgi:phosphatidylglycerophosphatase A